MPSFKLDELEIPFEPGDTVIQAAHRVGVDIPHYCWHPGLSVAANCRMCLVEVAPPPGRPAMMLDVLRQDPTTGEYVPAKKPKLQPACQLKAAEGMDVRSQSSPHVAEARGAVQEMLLLNHPVDCPICDQAGECRLQDYWLEHQGTRKRMRDEVIHKPKAQVFGPTIVYDAERCIICTRCVRFCEEVAKDPVLDVRERGNLNEIVVSPGRQLDHGYTLMTEFVCPVGALTAVDFRFKARVWFLRSVRSVCQGCATGCNAFLDYDPRNQTLYRHRPRENLQVNQYWMCDHGMLDYRRAHEDRFVSAYVGEEEVTLEAGVNAAASALREVEPERLAVVLSAQHSNEDNFALLTLARDYLGTGQLFITNKPHGEADGILRHADKNPNTLGVEQLCGTTPPRPLQDLLAAIEAGQITHVLALSSVAPCEVEALQRLKRLVLITPFDGPLAGYADVLLPAATWAESTGTFVNFKGMAQESERAIRPEADARPAWKLIGALGRALGYAIDWQRLSDVRLAMATDPGAVVAPPPSARMAPVGAAE
ncbi:MAG: (2Fe-2S)-binding protein [Polyangiaceae bacterium]|nr:(2Fe-2S)-binding protein [Polyangiaceae bacterium]MCW5791645.1 (2Fe-2S)-binding protein [Polyangiaceae bacterium]